MGGPHSPISNMRDTKQHLEISLARRFWEQRLALSIAALAVAAVALTLVVRRSELLPGEMGVTRWIIEHDGWAGREVAGLLDPLLNNNISPVLFALLIPVVWWAWGRYAAAIFLLAGAPTIPITIVELAYRPRPTDDLLWIPGISASGYPSGHVLYAVLVFGTLAYLAGRHMSPSWLRTSLRAFLVTIIVVMGPARVIVGDHWPADVVGAYLIGLPLFLAIVWLHPRLLPWLSVRAGRLHAALTADGRSAGHPHSHRPVPKSSEESLPEP